MALPAKQHRFVEEYLVDLNGAAAYVRAGYSAKGANAGAARLLANVSIQPAIQAAYQARSERTRIQADDVVHELANIAFSRMSAFADWGPDGVRLKPGAGLSEDAAACVAEVNQTASSIKFKLHGKLAALELLGKHLGLFNKVAPTDPTGTEQYGTSALTDEERVKRIVEILESAGLQVVPMADSPSEDAA